MQLKMYTIKIFDIKNVLKFYPDIKLLTYCYIDSYEHKSVNYL